MGLFTGLLKESKGGSREAYKHDKSVEDGLQTAISKRDKTKRIAFIPRQFSLPRSGL